MIEIDSITVVFGRTRALDRVTVQIDEGVTGVFGPNASGKSTLLRVLAGLVRLRSGRVAFNGRPLALSDEGFRRQVGYAGHESGLYGPLSVRENLELFGDLYGVPHARVGAMIRRLRIDALADTPVMELSAGLKRRVAVGRALLHEPELLLLDEPYANLDDEASEIVSAAVQEWRAPGRTAVIATHGAKRVRAFADAGIVLQRGQVASIQTGFRPPVRS